MFDDTEQDPDEIFARDRVLRIILDTENTVELKETLSYFDGLLLVAVGNQHFERWLRCSQCKEKTGYFHAKEHFEPNDDMEMCSHEEHEADGSFPHLEVQPPPYSKLPPPPPPLSGSAETEQKTDDGWNFSLAICNDKYTDFKGFEDLRSARADWASLVEALGNDHQYDMSLMGRKVSGRYNAEPGSKFEEIAEDRGCVNTEDVYDTVDTFIEDLKDQMETKKKSKIDSIFFLFLGHGVHVDGQDCLVGSSGKLTTVSSVKQKIETITADKYFMVIDACREEPEGIQFKLNAEHNHKYEAYLDSNFTMLYAAPRKWVAPDIPGNTLTYWLVEHLKTKKKIEVFELSKTLSKIWKKKQDRVKYNLVVETTAGKEETKFP
jgi:hypothetical protein